MIAKRRIEVPNIRKTDNRVSRPIKFPILIRLAQLSKAHGCKTNDTSGAEAKKKLRRRTTEVGCGWLRAESRCQRWR